jgi:hypothetical protein
LQVSWLDAVSSTDSNGRQLHHSAQLQDGSIAAAGQAVQFSGRQLAAAAAAGGLPQGLLAMLQLQELTGLLQCMWETDTGEMMAQASAAETAYRRIFHQLLCCVHHAAFSSRDNPWLLRLHNHCDCC